MSGRSSHPITTRSSRASAPNVGDPTSTPLPSQSSDPRPDGQFVMRETPEQLEELFSRRLAAIASAAQPVRTPARYFASQSSSSYDSDYGDLPRPANLQEVPTTSYRNTASVSSDTLKASWLTENGNESAKREDLMPQEVLTSAFKALIAFSSELRKANNRPDKGLFVAIEQSDMRF